MWTAALWVSASLYSCHTLRSAVLTSQIILWCHRCIYTMMPTNYQPAKISHIRTNISYKFDWKGFGDNPTSSAITVSPQNQLTTSSITPATRKQAPQGKLHCAVSVPWVLPRETTRLHTLYLELINAGQQRQQPYCSPNHALRLVTSQKERPSMTRN